MKKIIFCLGLFLFLFVPHSSNMTTQAQTEDSSIYAKIEYNNVYFFSLPENNDDSKLFMLPKSYFVKLLAGEGENFYYAQYDDIFGYVLKTSVTAMKGIPKSPYATTSFRVFSLEGIGLYKKPNISSEKMADIPYLSEQLTYYGTLQGQEVIPEKSNQWYYAKYSSSSKHGYVYSVFCDKLPLIAENTETFEIISQPLFVKDNSEESLSAVSMTFIIIGVSLPCLIVLYLLIKPTMLSQKITKASPKLKAKGNRDYFEFDESDLN